MRLGLRVVVRELDLAVVDRLSAGIARLRRSYGPIRHPNRPSLSLAGFRLAGHAPATHWGWDVRPLSRPLAVAPGDRIAVEAELRSGLGRQSLRVDLKE